MSVLAIAIAAIAFLGVVVLGALARRAPIGIDAYVARGAFGSATSVAWLFTNLGYARDIVLVYVIVGVTLRLREPDDLAPLACLALVQVVSQLISSALKVVFKRERPEHWLKRRETSAGYPSGHATTATVTYGGIALAAFAHVDNIRIAAPEVVGLVAIVCMLGIMWSRLALGAHYLSDVVGGFLLGSATLALLAGFLHRLG